MIMRLWREPDADFQQHWFGHGKSRTSLASKTRSHLQPGATPQVKMTKRSLALKARFIADSKFWLHQLCRRHECCAAGRRTRALQECSLTFLGESPSAN